MNDEGRMPNDETLGSYDSPLEHVKSYDAALDKALGIMCACLAVPALVMMGALLAAIFTAWQRRMGA